MPEVIRRSSILGAYYEPRNCALCGTAERFWHAGATLRPRSRYLFTRTERDIPEYHDITGPVMFGARDLDTRPLYPDSDMLQTMVRRCQGCGYCAHDVGRLSPGAETVVKSEAYRRQLHD